MLRITTIPTYAARSGIESSHLVGTVDTSGAPGGSEKLDVSLLIDDKGQHLSEYATSYKVS